MVRPACPPSPRHGRFRLGPQAQVPCRARFGRSQGQGGGELPKRLSGGEQQRVAIARALVNQPELLICDEPTGALDTKTSGEVLSVLRDAVREHATTLLLVTHDDDLAATCDITYTMSGGELHAPSID